MPHLGDPKLPSSLHYINPYVPNQYYTAISSVGSVIQEYDRLAGTSCVVVSDC
jgi:hypothetical protein